MTVTTRPTDSKRVCTGVRVSFVFVRAAPCPGLEWFERDLNSEHSTAAVLPSAAELT